MPKHSKRSVNFYFTGQSNFVVAIIMFMFASCCDSAASAIPATNFYACKIDNLKIVSGVPIAEAKKLFSDIRVQAEAQNSGMLVFHFYMDEDQKRATIIEIWNSEESRAQHALLSSHFAQRVSSIFVLEKRTILGGGPEMHHALEANQTSNAISVHSVVPAGFFRPPRAMGHLTLALIVTACADGLMLLILILVQCVNKFRTKSPIP